MIGQKRIIIILIIMMIAVAFLISKNNLLSTLPPLELPTIQAENVKKFEHDFNGDGINEIIVYYTEPIQWNEKEYEKQRLFVYRFSNKSWIKDHEDEGTTGILSLETEYFFKPFDLDGDKIQEAQIEKQRDGTGRYRQWYILKWDGNKVTDFFYPKIEEIKPSIQNLLKREESLGVITYQGKHGHIPICNQSCEFRQNPSNEIGSIDFTVSFKNGQIIPEEFTRNIKVE